jgi:hypothetical protein
MQASYRLGQTHGKSNRNPSAKSRPRALRQCTGMQSPTQIKLDLLVLNDAQTGMPPGKGRRNVRSKIR